MIPMAILGTGSALPGRLVSTEEVCARAYAGREPAELEARTGIQTRWFHEGTETFTSMALRALKPALASASMEPSALRRLILTSSTPMDHTVPATANDVADGLGARHTCDAFDLHNGCMGFLTALDIAARSVATGLGPVAVVAVELLSNHVDPSYPRGYAIFGDAAGAVIVGRSEGAAGVLGSHLGNDGHLRDSVALTEQEDRKGKSIMRFRKSNAGISEEAIAAIVTASSAALGKASLSVNDVDWFLFHQPNGVMFRKIADAVGAPPDRVVPIVNSVGSVGSASIPLSLDRIRRGGACKAGQVALLAAVGAGLAYGAMVVRL